MHPDKIRDPLLLQAEENLFNNKINVKQITEEVQKMCRHTIIYQTYFSAGANGSPRICPKCGLEIESYSSYIGVNVWSAKDFKKTPLDNHENRIVIEIENNIFFQARIKQ